MKRAKQMSEQIMLRHIQRRLPDLVVKAAVGHMRRVLCQAIGVDLNYGEGMAQNALVVDRAQSRMQNSPQKRSPDPNAQR